MAHPGNLSIVDYTYHLPDDRIAIHPLAQRDESKLLVYKSGKIQESQYRNLASFIPSGSLLVFNNTKVVEARLLFQKHTGSTIEIFCLEPAGFADVTTAMQQTEEVLWKCLVGGAKKWKQGPLEKTIDVDGNPVTLSVTLVEKKDDHCVVQFNWSDKHLHFATILHAAGSLPLPPYLNRQVEEEDKERYQTVYAKHDGSVAAPTAGLHFTPELLQQLQQQNIQQAFVTLHVGAGTFKPVKAATMNEHEMHAEFIEVQASFIQQLIQQLQNNQPVITVGTTSLRTTESLYWMGVKAHALLQSGGASVDIAQWDAYELPQHFTAAEALQHLLQWMQQQQMEVLLAKTQIIIAPGYQLRIAQALVTNFHQPQSTLLLLVAAITGNNWRTIYQYAMDHAFRFLSYGDGSLLWKD
ncbi:S-adenosylmethionine:tRNA ribosyltransferase-isomerase [Filimonas lacunae]|uniref:S-adenosylmethionine:tRNA ribosyltransferase-isomerase n=1 Tax=Filimonas lacunae TaxID=477680 RepID=A0A173MRN5_9BACT|nr:S-adenosylmethionine:tRNA ribosyltransferase-isomerase [Filimonas lacunae]BAV10345.1 S-adenosylmethionine:tRNA ribosyltransferase-isomerase [Filimonas lacunae]SIT16846.1 S-adenosylmethionine:tRNA ribosyltransferase-isomerase [Filimonas lacunae]